MELHKIMKFNRTLGGVLSAAALVMSAACSQDLNVADTGAPDVARALANPGDVENLAKSAIEGWYVTAAGYDPWVMLDVTADIMTMNYGNFGARFNNLQPRIPYANDPANGDAEVAAFPWSGNRGDWPGYYPTLGAANNVLKAVKGGLQLPDGTDQYKALAMWAQAASLMNLSLIYDKAFIVDENYDPTKTKLTLSPYKDVEKAALGKLDTLIAFLDGKGWTYAASDFSLSSGPLTSDLMEQVANTQAAMLLAYTPRNATDAATVNWQKVLDYANKGITSDFVVQGDGGNAWYSEMMDYFDFPSWMMVDQRLIHRMAPCVDSMYNGTNEPPNCAHDARVAADTAEADPNDDVLSPTGTDFVYTPFVQGDPSRGIWMQSPYYHMRYMATSWQAPGLSNDGPMPYILLAENDLLKAEAYVRLGNKAAAVPLINNTRVGRGKLAPVSITDSDQTLLDAITYEREVELLATNGYSFFYARHANQLQDGTVHHLPVPAKELETDGLPVYTFGGVGNPVENVTGGSSALIALHALTPYKTVDLALPNGTVMKLPVMAPHHENRALIRK